MTRSDLYLIWDSLRREVIRLREILERHKIDYDSPPADDVLNVPHGPDESGQ